MGYSTPHHGRDYVKAACLAICHDYRVRAYRLSEEQQRKLLEETREIDLCARVASFFGPTAHLAAQGNSDVDVVVTAPRLNIEVKYVRRKCSQWSEIKKDWAWLLEPTNVNKNFRKNFWVVFFPSTNLYDLTNCITVPHDPTEHVPFRPVMEIGAYGNGSPKPIFRVAPTRLAVTQVGDGKKKKRVRTDVIGSVDDPLWCVLYSRATDDAGDPDEPATLLT